MIYNYVCSKCGKKFERWAKPSKTNAQKYCSRKCYEDGRWKSFESTCPICKKIFITNSRNKHKKYCSNNCKHKAKIRDIVKVCPVCNKEFLSKKYNKKTYCSPKCWYDHYDGNKKINRTTGYTKIFIKGFGNVWEHRYIMEQKLGRKLKPWEQVHHINKNKSDNSLKNLIIVEPKEHNIYTIMERKINKLEKELKFYKEKYGNKL